MQDNTIECEEIEFIGTMPSTTTTTTTSTTTAMPPVILVHLS